MYSSKLHVNIKFDFYGSLPMSKFCKSLSFSLCSCILYPLFILNSFLIIFLRVVDNCLCIVGASATVEKARGNHWPQPLMTHKRLMDSFVFDVETSGSIPPDQVVQRALRILMEKFEKIRKDLESLDVNHPTDEEARLPEG